MASDDEAKVAPILFPSMSSEKLPPGVARIEDTLFGKASYAWVAAEMTKDREEIATLKGRVATNSKLALATNKWVKSIADEEVTYRSEVRAKAERQECIQDWCNVIIAICIVIASITSATQINNVDTTVVDLMKRIAALEQQGLAFNQTMVNATTSTAQPLDKEPSPLNRKTLAAISDWLLTELKPLTTFMQLAESMQSKHGTVLGEMESVKTRIESHKNALHVVDYIGRQIPFPNDKSHVHPKIYVCLSCDNDFMYVDADQLSDAVELVRAKLHEMGIHTLFLWGDFLRDITLLLGAKPFDCH